MSSRWTAVTAVVVGLAGVLGMAGALPASAHDELVSTDPTDGATVATAPDQVTLTFTDKAIALGTEVKVTGPDGSVVSSGDPQLGPMTVVQPLVAARPAGAYTVTWRVTSADGHPVSGTFHFTASAATGTAPAPTGSATGSATAPAAVPATDTPAPPAATPTPSATMVAVPAGHSSALSFWPFLVVVLIVAAATSALGRRSARRREVP